MVMSNWRESWLYRASIQKRVIECIPHDDDVEICHYALMSELQIQWYINHGEFMFHEYPYRFYHMSIDPRFV